MLDQHALIDAQNMFVAQALGVSLGNTAAIAPGVPAAFVIRAFESSPLQNQPGSQAGVELMAQFTASEIVIGREFATLIAIIGEIVVAVQPVSVFGLQNRIGGDLIYR